MFRKKEKNAVESISKSKKKKNIFSRICKFISGVILGVLITFAAILIIIFIMGKIAQQKGEYAPISLYTIISPSMTPNIAVYDVVVVKKTNPAKLKVGDVISFYSVNDYFDNTPITHRIVQVLNTTNGGLQFRTKGDANAKVDDEIVLANNVIGKVMFKIPQLGRVQFFLASKGGWFIAILIPALGVIAYDIVKLFKLIKVKKKMDYIKEANEDDDKPLDNSNDRNSDSYSNDTLNNKTNENNIDNISEVKEENNTTVNEDEFRKYEETDLDDLLHESDLASFSVLKEDTTMEENLYDINKYDNNKDDDKKRSVGHSAYDEDIKFKDEEQN